MFFSAIRVPLWGQIFDKSLTGLSIPRLHLPCLTPWMTCDPSLANHIISPPGLQESVLNGIYDPSRARDLS